MYMNNLIDNEGVDCLILVPNSCLINWMWESLYISHIKIEQNIYIMIDLQIKEIYLICGSLEKIYI